MTNGFGLDDAYSTTLNRIKEQKGSRAKLGMKALTWVSCSEQPLKAEELCHALVVGVLSLAKINRTSRDRKNFGTDNNTLKSTPNELKM